jgi:hypothetical protein
VSGNILSYYSKKTNFILNSQLHSTNPKKKDLLISTKDSDELLQKILGIFDAKEVEPVMDEMQKKEETDGERKSKHKFLEMFRTLFPTVPKEVLLGSFSPPGTQTETGSVVVRVLGVAGEREGALSEVAKEAYRNSLSLRRQIDVSFAERFPTPLAPYRESLGWAWALPLLALFQHYLHRVLPPPPWAPPSSC